MSDFTGIPFPAPYQSVLSLVDNTAATKGRAILLSVTVAGTITLYMADGTDTGAVAWPVGTVVIPGAWIKSKLGSGTATTFLLY